MQVLESMSQRVSTVDVSPVVDRADSLGTIPLGERRRVGQGFVVRAVGVGVSAASLAFAPGQAEAAPSVATVDQQMRSSEWEWSLESLPENLAHALATPGRNANPVATDAAARVLSGLAQHAMRPERVAVTRSGNVAITFVRVRRYATLECDADGDVVLAFSDRKVSEEAVAKVVTDTVAGALAHQIRSFLES
jgi:hypothetical protein